MYLPEKIAEIILRSHFQLLASGKMFDLKDHCIIYCQPIVN